MSSENAPQGLEPATNAEGNLLPQHTPVEGRDYSMEAFMARRFHASATQLAAEALAREVVRIKANLALAEADLITSDVSLIEKDEMIDRLLGINATLQIHADRYSPEPPHAE